MEKQGLLYFISWGRCGSLFIKSQGNAGCLFVNRYVCLSLDGYFGLSVHWLIQWGKNNLIPCWFCTFAHWERSYQSIILMVYLNSERQNNNKKSRKTVLKSYKLICILMSEISICPLRKTWLSTWWQNPFWQSQRTDVSCSWPPGLHTSQEGFFPTPLCRSSSSH